MAGVSKDYLLEIKIPEGIINLGDNQRNAVLL